MGKGLACGLCKIVRLGSGAILTVGSGYGVGGWFGMVCVGGEGCGTDC